MQCEGLALLYNSVPYFRLARGPSDLQTYPAQLEANQKLQHALNQLSLVDLRDTQVGPL